jgi:hypothetical protein
MIGAKPFDIPKREVWEAFKRVKANQTSRFGMSNGFALVMRLLPSPVGRLPQQDTAAPSVQSHYRTFTPTTGCSAPVPRIGTLTLVGASHSSFSLDIGTTGSRVPQQSLVRIHAASKPDADRAGLQGSARTCPGGHYLPSGFDTVL